MFKLSHFSKEEIQLQLTTKTVGELAKELNCTNAAIYTHCRKHGIKLQSKEIDLVGKTFGYYTVIKLIGSKNNRRVWECLCKCGNIKQITTSEINTQKYISCGCYVYSLEFKKIKRGKHNTWSGYEEISGKMWGRIKREAKYRKIYFDLNIEDAWNLFIKQNRKCALSNLELYFSKNHKEADSGMTTASLDRIDSSKGYIKDNIQWLHKDVNKIKWDYPEKYFIDLCKCIVNTKCKNIERM